MCVQCPRSTGEHQLHVYKPKHLFEALPVAFVIDIYTRGLWGPVGVYGGLHSALKRQPGCDDSKISKWTQGL